MCEIERSNYYTKLALSFILHNPGKFIKICLGRAYGFLKFMPNKGLVAQFSLSEFLMRISYLLSYSPLFIIFLLPIFIKEKPKEYYLFCLIFLYFLVVYSVIAGKMRYRLPVEPFLIISSAIFLRFAVKKFKKEIY
jgi:high-affinity Fe2+/Pb2+ permease